jgi:hypothetical protein
MFIKQKPNLCRKPNFSGEKRVKIMNRKKISLILTTIFCGAVFFQAMLTFGQTSCTPPPPNMVAWLAGDGNAHDLSGNGNNGFEGTQTAFAAGKVAQAFQFNGNPASSISISDSPSLHITTALTIDAWINPAAGNNGLPSILFKGNVNTLADQPYSIFFLPGSRQVNLRIGNNTTADAVSSVTALPLNVYTHVAATYDGTTMRIYINGVLDASQTTAIGTLNQTDINPVIIGSDIDGFIGAVDELEIFNRTLSLTEIQAIFNAGSAGKCKPLTPPSATTCAAPLSGKVAWLPGDGNTNDITGNGNNATPGTQTAFTAGKVVQAFQFNGSNPSSVSVPDAPSLHATNALSIDTWIFPTTPSGDVLYKGCFGSGNCQPYGILFTGFTATTGRLLFSLGNNTTFDRLATGSPIPLNTYTHVAVTYDGTIMKIYINGVLDSSKPTAIGTLNQTNTTDPLFIGNGPDGVFTGTIDEVEIFNRTLSDTEIFNTYNAGAAGECKSRIGMRVDFEGYGRNELSIFRADANPANPDFYIRKSIDNSLFGYSWGLPGDKLAPADYDGDGKTDIAVWRQNVSGNMAYFYILNSAGGTVRAEQFGVTGDILAVGDYDGDGKADLATYRDSAVGAQSYLYYRTAPNAGVNYLPFGQTGDKFVRGDYDGDGKFDVAVFRPSTDQWIIRNSSTGQISYQTFGSAGDNFVPADYDGDGKTDLAVFRPSNGVWYILQSSNNQVLYQTFGSAGDQLVPGDYDGDGKADIAIFRPSSGVWYILQSSTGSIQYSQLGQSGDTAVPSAYAQ